MARLYRRAGRLTTKHDWVAAPSSYGYYPADGVVQMMNAQRGKTHMPSARPLARVYMMGGVNPSNTRPKPSDGTQGAIDIQRASATPGQVARRRGAVAPFRRRPV